MSSQSAADVWTVVHYLHGVHLFAVVRVGWFEVACLAVLWEIWESTPWGVAAWNDPEYTGDAAANTAVDILATLMGWYVAASSSL